MIWCRRGGNTAVAIGLTCIVCLYRTKIHVAACRPALGMDDFTLFSDTQYDSQIHQNHWGHVMNAV